MHQHPLHDERSHFQVVWDEILHQQDRILASWLAEQGCHCNGQLAGARENSHL